MRSATLVRGLRAVAPYLPARYRWWFAALAAIGLTIGALEAIVLTFIGRLAASLDDVASFDVPVLGSVGWGTLVVVGVVALVGAIALRVVEAHLISTLGVFPLTRLRARLIEGYLGATFTQQRSERLGGLQEVLTTHAPYAGLTAYAIATAISASAVLAVLGIAAAVVDPVAFGVVVAIGVVLVGVTFPFQRLARRFSIRQSRSSMQYAVTAAETIASSTEITLFAATDVAARRVHDDSEEVSHFLYRTRFVQSLTPYFFRSLVLGVVLVVLGALAANGLDDVAAASAVALLTIRALIETQRIHGVTIAAAECLSYVDQLHAWLDRYDAAARSVGERALAPITSVEIVDVHHRYAEGTDTLDGANLTIAAGERVGIVGASGVGKTTLLAMVLGLLEPTSGRVLVNGHAPAEHEPESWSRQVAAVPQTPVILTASARDNIRFFRDWVSDDDIVAAAGAAGILGEIESWPDGYDTIIGDRGARALSGGQRQRVCIARALAGRPSLLVMDEPTSSLDRAAEEVVSNTIDALGDTCAVVVVSHRATALRSCERLLRLEDGQLSSVAETVADTH